MRKYNVEELAEMRKTMSIQEVADHFGVTYSSMTTILSNLKVRAGMTKRKDRAPIRTPHGKMIAKKMIDLELLMGDIAERMNIHPARVSNVLHDTGGKSFSKTEWNRLFDILEFTKDEREVLFKTVKVSRENPIDVSRMTDEQFDEYIQNLKNLRASSEKD